MPAISSSNAPRRTPNNRTRIAETTGAGASIVAAECFTYDHQRRLTEAWTTTAGTCQATPSAAVIGGTDPYWHTYAYDVVGNRTGETVHGTGGAADATRTYTDPAAGGTRPHALTAVTGPAWPMNWRSMADLLASQMRTALSTEPV